MQFQLPENIAAAAAGRLATAIELARLAGAETLRYFQQDSLSVDRKADDSPVTAADRGAEQRIREELARRFPQDAILGEEFGEQTGDSGFQWIIDPIDGTKSFICGVPLYSTLVGIVQGRQTIGGVIYLPALDEIVFAARQFGAWHAARGSAPKRCHVSRRRLEEGLFVTSQIDSFWSRGARSGFHALQDAASITRTWGDGYGYLLVATGRAEAMVDPVANPWDLAAVQVVVEEAGGRFTSWQGEPHVFDGDGVGTNGMVHDQVLTLLHIDAQSSPSSSPSPSAQPRNR